MTLDPRQGRFYVGPGDRRTLELGIDGITYLAISSGGVIYLVNGATLSGVSGTGDVVGPASAVDNRIVLFDGTTGKLIKDSGALLSSYLTIAAAALAYQPLDADLTALAGVTSAADALPYFTGSGSAAVTTLTSFMRTVLDDTTQAAARTTLGVGTGDSPEFTGVNIGHASDTTLTRVSAGVAAIEGSNILLASGLGSVTQAFDAELSAIAGLTSAADKVPYFTGSGSAAVADFTAAGRALVDDAAASNQRATLVLDKGAFLTRDPAPINETFTWVIYSPFACTIDTLTHQLDSGTLTVAVKINGTNITSLSAVSVSNSLTSTNATGANTVAIGDKITVAVSSVSSPVGLAMALRYTR